MKAMNAYELQMLGNALKGITKMLQTKDLNEPECYFLPTEENGNPSPPYCIVLRYVYSSTFLAPLLGGKAFQNTVNSTPSQCVLKGNEFSCQQVAFTPAGVQALIVTAINYSKNDQATIGEYAKNLQIALLKNPLTAEQAKISISLHLAMFETQLEKLRTIPAQMTQTLEHLTQLSSNLTRTAPLEDITEFQRYFTDKDKSIAEKVLKCDFAAAQIPVAKAQVLADALAKKSLPTEIATIKAKIDELTLLVTTLKNNLAQITDAPAPTASTKAADKVQQVTPPPANNSKQADKAQQVTPPPQAALNKVANKAQQVTPPPANNSKAADKAQQVTPPPASSSKKADKAQQVTPPPASSSKAADKAQQVTPPPANSSKAADKAQQVTPPPASSSKKADKAQQVTLPPASSSKKADKAQQVTPPPASSSKKADKAQQVTPPPASSSKKADKAQQVTPPPQAALNTAPIKKMSEDNTASQLGTFLEEFKEKTHAPSDSDIQELAALLKQERAPLLQSDDFADALAAIEQYHTISSRVKTLPLGTYDAHPTYDIVFTDDFSGLRVSLQALIQPSPEERWAEIHTFYQHYVKSRGYGVREFFMTQLFTLGHIAQGSQLLGAPKLYNAQYKVLRGEMCADLCKELETICKKADGVTTKDQGTRYEVLKRELRTLEKVIAALHHSLHQSFDSHADKDSKSTDFKRVDTKLKESQKAVHAAGVKCGVLGQFEDAPASTEQSATTSSSITNLIGSASRSIGSWAASFWPSSTSTQAANVKQKPSHAAQSSDTSLVKSSSAPTQHSSKIQNNAQQQQDAESSDSSLHM